MITEGVHTAEFLLSEGNGSISREQVTVTQAGSAMDAGQVLALVANKYVAYNPAASDGSEVAAAVLYGNLPEATGDVRAVVIARQAEVAYDRLTGVDAAAVADLATKGIIVR